MELKPGYKQTEVGVIPEDWELLSVKKVFSFLSTGAYSRDKITSNGECCYIHYGDIHTKWNFFIDFSKSEIPKIDKKLICNYSIIKDGDLILADASEDMSGIGKSAEVKSLLNRIAISGLHTFLLRDSSDRVVNGFKAYITSNRLVKTQLDRLATGLKVYGISKKNLGKVMLPIPAKQEQQSIANALSDADELIQSMEKFIAKKRHIKKGAMQDLLTGKKRLPGFEVVRGNKQTEIGLIPKDWEVKRLGELIWFQEGPGLRNWQFKDKGLKVINITNLQISGTLDLEKTDRYIDWIECDKMYKHFLIDENDFVMASSGNSYCKTSIVRKCDLPLLMNTSVIRFKPIKIDYKYMCSYLRSKYFKNQIDLLITGGAQPNFGPAHLIRVNMLLPSSINEQAAIANILSDMDKEIETLETKLDKYKEIKQGMMQELLTGRIRLV